MAKKKTPSKDQIRLDNELKLMEELIQEEMYQRSESRLFDFFINFWNTFDPSKLVPNWHLECMCEHIQAAMNREIRRLCICIPPRSSKSTTASITAPTWKLLDDPGEKFWLISHSQKLFQQNIIYARRILDHPNYKNRWCSEEDELNFKFALSPDQNTKSRIENDQGGYILGGSPKTGALGMGYTIAVLDDILDSEESYSREAIQTVNDWYTQTFLNRSNDVNNDVQIIVAQRLAENDIVGYVNKKYTEQDWFILNLPAKYEPTLTFISPIGFNDKRTIRNQLLDPVRLPDSFLAVQAKDPILYNTRYQQNPGADTGGNLVQAEWLRETDVVPKELSVIITAWDLNITDSPRSDYTVGIVVAKYEDEFHVIDMFRKQCNIPEQVDAIKRMSKKYKKSIVGIEARANGHAAVSLLTREMPSIYLFEPRKFGGKKEQRLGAVLKYFRDKKVCIYNPFKEDKKLESTYSASAIKKELKSFPLSSNDDIVDALSYALNYLAEYGQEGQAMITKGHRITIDAEDYIDEALSKRGSLHYINYDNYDFNQDFIPNKNDIMDIDW